MKGFVGTIITCIVIVALMYWLLNRAPAVRQIATGTVNSVNTVESAWMGG